MQLEKWYADCVSPRGETQVRYAAHLHWAGLRLGYHSALHSASGAGTSYWRLGGVALPQVCAGGADWPAARDAAALRYEVQCTGAPVVLHTTPDGATLTWEPVVLNGLARSLDGTLQGRGYVERLRLNFAPWALGLRRLLWGRFCGEQHSLAWIVWEGRLPQSLAWLDGQPCGALQFGEGHIVSAQGARLQWQDAQPLLCETLAQGSLRGLRLVRHAALLRFLQAQQTKWHAAAHLHLPGCAPDAGHMVFEEVQWP